MGNRIVQLNNLSVMKTKLLFGLSLLVILFSCTNDDSSMPGLADVRQIATTDVYVSVLDTNKTVNMDKAKYVAQLYREKNFSEYVSEDKEHIYVNIVKDECGKDTTGYRIIVKEPVIDGVSMYAVDKCI